MNIIRIKTSEFGATLGEIITQNSVMAKQIFKHPFDTEEFANFRDMAGFVEYLSGGKRKTRTFKFEAEDE